MHAAIPSPSDFPRQRLAAELFVSWRSHTQHSGPPIRGVGRRESGASLDHTHGQPRMPPPPLSSAVALSPGSWGSPAHDQRASVVWLACCLCLTSLFHCRLFPFFVTTHGTLKISSISTVWNYIAFLRYPERLVIDAYPRRACMLRRGENHDVDLTVSDRPTTRAIGGAGAGTPCFPRQCRGSTTGSDKQLLSTMGSPECCSRQQAIHWRRFGHI